jgi:molecular chaperone GrpE (heat shock protein)
MRKPSFLKFRSVPRKLNLGISKAKEVHEDFDKLKEQAARNQRELQETVDYTLLQLIAETLPKQEMLLQSYGLVQKTGQDMEEALKKHDVERFSPIVGDSVPRDKCKVVGQIETDKLFPGSVARVINEGSRIRKNGRILVFPAVLESVAPPGKKPVSEKSADIEAPDARERNSAGGQQ